MDNIRNELVQIIEPYMNERSCAHEDGDCSFGMCKRCRARNLAEHLIANGVTAQRWIPVEERLPADDVQVLACTKHGKAFSAHLENGRWRVSNSVKITHWMPLPEPPGKDVGGDA